MSSRSFSVALTNRCRSQRGRLPRNLLVNSRIETSGCSSAAYALCFYVGREPSLELVRVWLMCDAPNFTFNLTSEVTVSSAAVPLAPH